MTRLISSDVVLCYDGSLEGFLSTVFRSYATHRVPAMIASRSCIQIAFEQTVEDVPTDLSCAERVKVGLAGRAGLGAYEKVKMAFLSDEMGREREIFDYIVHAMECGYRVNSDLADPAVARVEALARSVLNEREKMYQFLRFEEVEQGVFFARINPKANVIPLLMDHFVERFNIQPFVIYDEVHHIAGVYDGRGWYLAVSDELQVPEHSCDEKVFQRLWKTFYDSISNEQRYNPDLRRKFVPQRLWRNMTEFKMATEEPTA